MSITQEHIWVDGDGRGGWWCLLGKDKRLIVVHAGGVEGCVSGTDLVFKWKTNSVVVSWRNEQ